jgi:gamma-glutamylcyclotransferase (GGCT)/AIG2-like uncharacterized protein YtfP
MIHIMDDLLFTYGTLQPGNAPPEIADVVRRFDFVGEATTAAKVFDLGEYPGAKPSAVSRLKGKVYRVPDPSLWARLDDYEGVDKSNLNRSLFVRRKRQVRFVDGRRAICWVYFYNRPIGSAEKKRIIKESPQARHRSRSAS